MPLRPQPGHDGRHLSDEHLLSKNKYLASQRRQATGNSLLSRRFQKTDSEIEDMAKKSMMAKNRKRQRLVEVYREKRAELKAIWTDTSRSPEEREEAFKRLNRLPRDSSPTRVRNRCALTGRPRAYYRKFGLSRIALRDLARRGELPGVTKSSW